MPHFHRVNNILVIILLGLMISFTGCEQSSPGKGKKVGTGSGATQKAPANVPLKFLA